MTRMTISDQDLVNGQLTDDLLNRISSESVTSLYLSNCRSLTSLPDNLPTNLTSLDLYNCSRLTSLPNNLPASLTSLGLTDCRSLTSLPDNLPDGLTSLNLSHCSSLTSLPDNLPTSLTSLNLSGCESLTSLPDDLPTSLTSLDLTGCTRLTSLPDNLPDSLTSLDLSYCSSLASLPDILPDSLTSLGLSYCLRLTSLPDNLPASLTSLGLSYCLRLTSLPDILPDSLTSLDLSHCSSLTSLPDDLPDGLTSLNLSDCRNLQFPDELIGRLRILEGNCHIIYPPDYQAANQGIGAIVHSFLQNHQEINNTIAPSFLQNLSIHQPPTTNQGRVPNNTVKTSILNLCQNEEERNSFNELLGRSDFGSFNRFLEECSRTAGWQSSQAEMTQSLRGLIGKMVECEKENNSELTSRCLVIAETAFETCGDRVALAYVQMILAKNLPQKPVSEMTTEELFAVAQQEAVTHFLNEKAEEKIAVIRTAGGPLDEIETYLAYLQAAPRLGVELPASEMRFRGCSNVSDQNLQDATGEFAQQTIHRRAAERAYNDDLLKTHPLIQEIITAESNKDVFDTFPLKGESDQTYRSRLASLQTELTRSIINALENEFKNLSNEQVEEESKSDLDPEEEKEDIAVNTNQIGPQFDPPVLLQGGNVSEEREEEREKDTNQGGSQGYSLLPSGVAPQQTTRNSQNPEDHRTPNPSTLLQRLRRCFSSQRNDPSAGHGL